MSRLRTRAYIFHIGKSRLICTFDNNDDERKENLTIDGVKRKTADDGKLLRIRKTRTTTTKYIGKPFA